MTDETDPIDFTRSTAETETVPFQTDWARAERPSIAVVEAIAAVTGREPTNLPPLHDYVDADALNDLVTIGSDDPRGRVIVSFDYDGIGVTVDSNGRIQILSDADATE